MPLAAQMLNQITEQRRGQVVNAVSAGVFKDVERDRLAGPGKATEQHKLHARKDTSVAIVQEASC